MRIALIHNPTAGTSNYRTEDLESLFRSVGHTVRTYGKEKPDLKRAVQSEPDVIVAAGGDGTIAGVALVMHKRESKAALYVLPVGTANNIARTLGVQADVPDLAIGLENARRERLDIGVVKTPWGSRRFVEGAGFGFIGTMLEQDGTIRERLSRAKRRVRGMLGPMLSPADKSNRGVARLVRAQRPMECRVRADDENLDGEYIAIECMNIRELGPHVALATDAHQGDGRLDLLLVRPSDRAALADYIEAGEAPKGPPPGILRRVKRVEMPWPKRGGHVDDQPWPCEDEHAGRVRIKVTGAIEVLVGST